MHNLRLQKLEILMFDWWYNYWSVKFCKHGGYNKKMQSNGGFVFISNKKL